MFLGLQQLMDSLPAFGNFWAACVCHVCVSAARTILPHDLSNIYTHAQYWTGCCSSAIGRRRLRSLLRLISGGYICSRGMYCVDLFAHLSEFLLPHVVLDATGGHVTSSGQESDRQRCRTGDRIRTGSGQTAVPDSGQVHRAVRPRRTAAVRPLHIWALGSAPVHPFHRRRARRGAAARRL